MNPQNQIKIYQTADGQTQINIRFEQDTVWLNRQQLAQLFDRDIKTIGKHINNVFKEGELQKDSVVAKYATTAQDGKTYQVDHYNLDVVISVGYREQTVFGEPAYPSIESKAAHLLYFVVKNHPFSDGNKRSGAFLFVDFLNRNGRLLNRRGEVIINDTGLAALTLLVAESDPKQKDTLIRLIMHMLTEDVSL
ncbi:Fic family protein [Desulfobacterota bacterium M19]